MVQNIFFLIVLVFTLGMGLYVTVGQNLIRSAFALFFTLFGMAGFYILLGGDFIAMVQLLVYAGGIAVLLTFGAMLTAEVDSPFQSNQLFNGFWTFVSGVGFFSLIYYVLMETDWPLKAANYHEPTTKEIGRLLLQQYILPFEVISFLLLVAMVGAIFLVQKGDRQ
ncbi:MAG: NADH-quinone oxidoreductase subunit J [bacterium]|nr:NADH-quinone oxidoreductase subunit J [bacterium]